MANFFFSHSFHPLIKQTWKTLSNVTNTFWLFQCFRNTWWSILHFGSWQFSTDINFHLYYFLRKRDWTRLEQLKTTQYRNFSSCVHAKQCYRRSQNLVITDFVIPATLWFCFRHQFYEFPPFHSILGRVVPPVSKLFSLSNNIFSKFHVHTSVYTKKALNVRTKTNTILKSSQTNLGSI